MSDEDLRAELERLKEENERLKAQKSRAATLKVSEKGGVSVYGLGRFPVTLYDAMPRFPVILRRFYEVLLRTTRGRNTALVFHPSEASEFLKSVKTRLEFLEDQARSL